MEAEARAILAAVCMEGDSRRPASALQDWVGELYGLKKPRKVVDALIAERRREQASGGSCAMGMTRARSCSG